MKFLLRIAGVLKILFIINIFLFEYLQNIEFQKISSDSWGSFTIDIEFPWYVYLLILLIIVSFLINILAVNIIAFLPNTKASKYLLKKPVSRIIYFLEIPLFLAALVALSNNYDNAFSRPQNSLFGQSVEFFSSTPERSFYGDIIKLEILNYTLPILSAIIILTFFWKFRAMSLKSSIS